VNNYPLIPYPTTFLLVDVMYFHAAMQNFANAVEQKDISLVIINGFALTIVIIVYLRVGRGARA
jgi:hypothetical protein